MPIQVGDVIGDYQVVGVLGRGGMGKVFRVRSLLTDREEAMKVVLNEDPSLADRFLREIKVHASLQHPNIAALHAAMRIDERVVMIMELVEGVTLEETLRHGPVEVPLAIRYLKQMVAALAFAHDRKVIHRDIKPANILIAHGGIIKLTDFGIARATGGPGLTSAGLAVGTVAYMSPEQILTGKADARSDLYSLGLTAYEMVTGIRPIQGETEHALMNAQVTVMPNPPSSVNPRVPEALSAAIMHTLAKDPNQRYQSALEFRFALMDTGQASGPVPITPVTAGTPSTPSTPSAAILASPELAELEARLSRAIGPIAKRLVADAARRYGTIAEIRQALASQIDDPKEREIFFKTKPSDATVTMLSDAPRAPVSFDPAALDRLAQALAPYIGPIAKVMVTRASRTARSAEELQTTLASEIASEADRRQFLAAARSIL